VNVEGHNHRKHHHYRAARGDVFGMIEDGAMGGRERRGCSWRYDSKPKAVGVPHGFLIYKRSFQSTDFRLQVKDKKHGLKDKRMHDKAGFIL
jgi:hypothetical protein